MGIFDILRSDLRFFQHAVSHGGKDESHVRALRGTWMVLDRNETPQRWFLVIVNFTELRIFYVDAILLCSDY